MTRSHLPFVLAACLFGRLAAAQTPAPAPASQPALADALQGPAKQSYESAKLLAANRDFAGALIELKRAYELSKDPRLLFNMAICEKEIHHYARMKAVLDQYIREGGAQMTPETRSTVDEALAAIKPLVSSLKVDVSEPGAEIRLDGQKVGVSPLASPLSFDHGQHTLSVSKPGFNTVEQAVDSPGGVESQVAVTLNAESHVATLLVTTSPGAAISVDGKPVGEGGRFEGSLPAGTHEVAVSEQGKKPYKAQLDLRDSERRTVTVTLEQQDQAVQGGSNAWIWVVGGVALAAGAAVGGYFLFKPQDQTNPVPPGKGGSVQFNAISWGRR